MWSSVFLIFNWVLAIAFVPRPLELADKIFYGGVAVILTFPIFFAVIFDWPRDRSTFYQIFLTVSVYSWSVYQLFFIYFCGYYSHNSHFRCGKKDFIGIF
jgi:osomolarity two-component system, sensor histidine kinase SLN1